MRAGALPTALFFYGRGRRSADGVDPRQELEHSLQIALRIGRQEPAQLFMGMEAWFEK